jgi:glutathione S-transferase
MSAGLILHEDPISGNCYKIRLTAALLGIQLECRAYHIRAGETRTPEFLARINPNGRIPVLECDGRFMPESNAACWWLARDSALIPSDPWHEADVLRWMFFEQYNHEPNIATLRFWLAFVGQDQLSDAQRQQIPGKRAAGIAALQLLNSELAARDWLVGDGVTLADIALFAYTHVCEEGGGFTLADYPAVERWIARIEALPGFAAMRD